MKNLEKLVQTGQWYWREGEISYKSFQSLDRPTKDAHIQFLLSLDKDDRSTNDEYILRFFAPKEVEEKINFFSIKIISTKIDASIPDEIELIKNIPNLSKKEIKELIDAYYSHDYPNWEMDLRQSKIDIFIENTKSLYEYNSYIIGLLTTYKTI